MTHSPTIDAEARPGDRLLPEDIGKPLAATVAGHHRHAIMIVDVNGIIRFAATRGMFGCADEELTDNSLATLIPTLPMREKTPGYNIAFVRLNFADRAWRRHRAVSADRGAIPVEVHARPLPIGRSFALLVAVREVHSVDHPVRFRGWQALPRADRSFAA